MSIRQAVDIIVGYLISALTIMGIVRDQQKSAAQESIPYSIETIVTNAELAIINPTSGLEAAHTERLGLLDAVNLLQINTASPHPATLTDILAAFGDIPTYTLPETPPPGYGGTIIGLINVPQICGLD
jgi:hypothetical protein